MSALTVRQLIAELEKLDQDAEVCIEGCDCWGDASGVRVLDGETVLVERSD